jgi:TolB protein
MRFLGKILFVFTIFLALAGILALFYYYDKTANGTTTEAIPLFTSPPAQSVFPGKIAFVSNENGNRVIKTINPNTGTTQTILQNNGIQRNIAVSPNGKMLAFGIAQKDTALLYVMDLPDGKPKAITQPANNFMPTFSFDGTHLVYVQDHGGSFRTLMEVNLKTLHTKPFMKPRHWYSDPKFLPNGEIVCTAFWGGQDQIVLLNPKDDSETNLTQNNYGNLQPAVSSDGKKIVFVSNRDGNPELYTMNVDGSNVHRLTFTTNIDYEDPSWSPDGKYIVYASNGNGKSDILATSYYSLFIMDENGNIVKRLTFGTSNNFCPVWYEGKP